jgi:plasmid stabilization system protein ParE
MPRPGWSPKRERQYEHIRDGLLERGMSLDKAEEIAARTVNKERSQTGEARAGRTGPRRDNDPKHS